MFFVKMLQDLRGEPAFHRFTYVDENPLCGTVKVRTLYNPNEAMELLHGRFLKWLRSKHVALPSATCGRSGCSPRKNVERHQRNRYFYLLDIKDAYRHVDSRRLTEYVCDLDSKLIGQEERMEQFLKAYFFLSDDGGLVTGGACSVELYNIYAGMLIDRALQKQCQAYQITYTRYLDDLTFSSRVPMARQKTRTLRAIIQRANLPINDAKTQRADLRKQTIIVTGICLSKGGRLLVPRLYLRHLKGFLHQAIRLPQISSSQVEGTMSVFKATTDPWRMNATERKIAKLYQNWRKLNQR